MLPISDMIRMTKDPTDPILLCARSGMQVRTAILSFLISHTTPSACLMGRPPEFKPIFFVTSLLYSYGMASKTSLLLLVHFVSRKPLMLSRLATSLERVIVSSVESVDNSNSSTKKLLMTSLSSLGCDVPLSLKVRCIAYAAQEGLQNPPKRCFIMRHVLGSPFRASLFNQRKPRRSMFIRHFDLVEHSFCILRHSYFALSASH